MKKLAICMASFSILMTAVLLVISHNLTTELKPYRTLEGDMKEAASIYMLQTDIDLAFGESLKINSSTLLENEYIDSMTVDEDECVGYVMVNKTTDFNYESYIKCQDYTTKDYE